MELIRLDSLHRVVNQGLFAVRSTCNYDGFDIAQSVNTDMKKPHDT
jgi:hypothetical protein